MTAPARDQVFISYSHKDKKWLDRLETHLKPRIRNGKVNVWNDQRLKAGEEWRKEIDEALARAKVAVLLVSPHFLASDFIANDELPPLLEAAKQGGVKILWVPVSTAAFKEAKIDIYQAVLDPIKPLDKHHHAHVSDAMEKICNAISQAFSAT
ncbi:MAG: toll/interleukin-1 receptor domain-containing protein [Hyalangium sp.]|uniref:toll/interleukin-1 receptor domain-containing protein n=1 Tax=Hyalangium sp. TaxID=2028555 RepID=UPI00389A971A